VVGAPDNVDQEAALSLPAMPFADGAFALVTNRHESFVAAEVARVLAPGGRFVTQQVGPDLGAPYRSLLGARPGPAAASWGLAGALDQADAAGLEITGSGQGAATISFADVGALAWYLIHVPWVMPEFSMARHREGLEALHGRGAVSAPQPMFWLTARKPGEPRPGAELDSCRQLLS
jgi:SAM-dependent methyltransferase